MPKISIVSAYYNCKESLWKTLKSINQSKFKDFEYIIVDDASDQSQRIENLVKEFDFVRLIRIEPEDKHHVNSCIPFNLGFSLIKSDIVIIQYPECLHVGDVLSFVNKNSKDNQYITFSCYSLSENASKNFNIKNVKNFQPKSVVEAGKYNSWLVHPIHRPAHYNYLTSITTKDLMDLGGFDERFANGVEFNKDEFADRIKKKNMNIEFIESPFCVYQHNKTMTNRELYENCVKSSNYKIDNGLLQDNSYYEYKKYLKQG